MVDRVFKAPVNLFFDVTPIGTILNKFSKDLSMLQGCLRCDVGGAYYSIYQLISIFSVAAYTVPAVVTMFPVLLLILILLYRNSIAATKEMSRIESVTRSPLLSYLSEVISGNQTIRAFQKESQFIEHNNELLNKNMVAAQWQNAVPLWFAIRVDLLATFAMVLISSFCVLERRNANPIMLALLLTYSTQVQQCTITSVRMIA